MIVVSDTSPICYLLLLDLIDLLPQLYQKVFIPQAVADELMATDAPLVVQTWMNHPPDWIIIEKIITNFEPMLENLDLGEKEAIILAERLSANLVILDDKDARKIALKRGLEIIGLVGILRDAAELNLIDLSSNLQRLKQFGFRIKPSLLEKILNSKI